MSIETGVVLDDKLEPVFWHMPPGRSAGGLPDSRRLWDVLWEGRKTISGFAHSHPGSGETGPSFTDVTTFAAIEAALGRRLDWWITSETDLILIHWHATKDTYPSYRSVEVVFEPSWLRKLRHLSYEPTNY